MRNWTSTAADTGLRCDVAVVGGGPAGAATSRELARAGLAVVLLDRTSSPRMPMGENLPASARGLLERLGLWGCFCRLNPLPAFGTKSIWGDVEVRESVSIMNRYGHGWHLDRRRFDEALWQQAAQAGALALRGVTLAMPRRTLDGWALTGTRAGSLLNITARTLVDATGRAAWLSRLCGWTPRAVDRLVGTVFGFSEPLHEAALVEAVSDGWWYSAPLPGERSVATFLTDADLCASIRKRCGSDFREWAHGTQTAARFHDHRPDHDAHGCVAMSQLTTVSESGNLWPVGDSAMALDPLSSLGLSFALASAIQCAQSITRQLLGVSEGELARYLESVRSEYAQYLATRREVYERERRFAGTPFWDRRHAA